MKTLLAVRPGYDHRTVTLPPEWQALARAVVSTALLDLLADDGFVPRGDTAGHYCCRTPARCALRFLRGPDLDLWCHAGGIDPTVIRRAVSSSKLARTRATLARARGYSRGTAHPGAPAAPDGG